MLKTLDPTDGPASKDKTIAPRFGTLNGLKIGVLWNGRPYGDRIFSKVFELLRTKYTFEVTTSLKKAYLGNMAPPEYFEKLVADKVDAVLCGVGD